MLEIFFFGFVMAVYISFTVDTIPPYHIIKIQVNSFEQMLTLCAN